MYAEWMRAAQSALIILPSMSYIVLSTVLFAAIVHHNRIVNC